MLDIAKMKYHIGQKVRIYPDYAQRKVISMSDGAERSVYNRLVALNKEKYRLGKIGRYLKPVAERLDYIKTVLSSKKELMNMLPYLDDDRIDSLCIDNAYMNYSTAWDNYYRNPVMGIPTFHKKSYCKTYHTNPHYKAGAVRVSDCNVKLLDKNHVRCRS